ncbi:hypothetical protein YTPLAS18_13520 [Nitrospira sp.]|nr:hypothetical protein YTPLAS18_13520 [Nitrospira sp.]
MLGRAGDDLRVPYHDGTVLVRVGPERRAAAVVRRIECAEVQGSALQEPAKRMVGRTRPIILIADHARPSTIEIGSTALDIGGIRRLKLLSRKDLGDFDDLYFDGNGRTADFTDNDLASRFEFALGDTLIEPT